MAANRALFGSDDSRRQQCSIVASVEAFSRTILLLLASLLALMSFGSGVHACSWSPSESVHPYDDCRALSRRQSSAVPVRHVQEPALPMRLTPHPHHAAVDPLNAPEEAAAAEGAVDEAIESGTLKVTGKTGAGAARPPRHHIFPQEHRAFFESRGVKIDRYTFELGQGEHSAIHTMGFNERWKQFIEAESQLGRQYTKQEILREGVRIKREFQIAGKHMPYKD